MPPALVLIAEFFMGTLSGGWGLVLTSVTPIIIVLVLELHIKKRSKISKQYHLISN